MATAAIAMQMNLFTGGICAGEGTRVYFGSDAARDRPASKRPTRALHSHSLAATEHRQDEHKGRKALILDCLRVRGKPLTARQILADLFPGHEDMNLVRPRISDLVRERTLVEAGEIADHRTGETVSTFWFSVAAEMGFARATR